MNKIINNDLSLLDNKTNKIILQGTKGNEFGKEIVSAQCSIAEVLNFMCIDEEVQRDLDENKVAAISKYIQGGLGEGNIYFSPLILSARRLGVYEKNIFAINMTDKLIVLDGQHRIMGFIAAKKRLLILIGKNPENLELKEMYENLMNFPISIKIYMDLVQNQERQLFTDINTKASAVNNTLLIMYKEDDLYGQVIKNIIFNSDDINQENFELRARSTRKKMMTAATLYIISKALNDGSYNIKDLGKINKENCEIYEKNTKDFIHFLNKYLNYEIYGDRNKYIVYIPSVLIGIAMFIYRVKSQFPDIIIENLFKTVITKINWTHQNNDFSSMANKYNKKINKYNFNSSIRVINGIANYLLEKLDKGEQCTWNL